MATNAALTGGVTLAIDGSTLTGNGQFTTQDGFAMSVAEPLTPLMTAQAQNGALQLLGLLKQQYTIWRQNLVSPQAKVFLWDTTDWVGDNGATLAADPSLAYAGAQSLKVSCPGAVAGEGTLRTLPGLGKGQTATVTVLVQLSAGASAQLVLADTANTTDTYTAVSPATTPPTYTKTSAPITASSAAVSANSPASWQAITQTLVLGTGAAPVLAVKVVTSAKLAASIWLGAVQVTAA